jgi:hypothetical protein
VSYATAKEWRDAWQGEAATWRDKRGVRAALVRCDQIKASEQDRARTLKRIADACIEAAHYRPDADPGPKFRKAMRETRDKVPDMAAAARTLAKACECADRAMMFALPGGNNALQVSLARPHDGQRIEITKMGAAWFTELEQGLKEWFNALEQRPKKRSLGLHQVGNLLVPKSIGAGRKIDVSTMLAFELVYYLRMFTAGRAAHIVSSLPMPKDGKPCYDLAAMFCNATLGSNLDARQVADRLRKLPAGVRLVRWPKNAE